jgi:uncharacterized membrane protein
MLARGLPLEQADRAAGHFSRSGTPAARAPMACNLPPPAVFFGHGRRAACAGDSIIMTSDTLKPAYVARAVVDQSLLSYTHVIYGLHALAALMGVISTATTVVGGFIFGLPSIIAVIMNYVRRSDARGTYLESHFTWQIRTFWFALLWAVVLGAVSLPLTVILIGFGLWYIGALLLGAWIIYRVARGWAALRDGRAMYS